jgi:hypothetical protein
VDRDIWIWDALRFESLLAFEAHESGITCLSFSPDGLQLASGSLDKTVKFWESRSAYDPSLLEYLSKIPIPIPPTGLSADVLTYLKQDSTLPETMRASAVQYIRKLGDWPNELNESSWRVARSPGATIPAYRLAFRQAETASRILPFNPAFLDTLAAAHYRLGEYEDVLKIVAVSRKRRPRPSIPGTAFLAMAQYRLGNVEKAKVDFEELQGMKKNYSDLYLPYPSLFDEAESLFESR